MALKLESHIERVLWDQHQISRRVSELASQISADFGGAANSDSPPPPPPPVLVGVATGAFLFLADLVRNIDLPISVDFVRADSYGSGTISAGAPKLSLDLKVDVKGKHVILVLSHSLSLSLSLSHWLSDFFNNIPNKGFYSFNVMFSCVYCTTIVLVLKSYWMFLYWSFTFFNFHFGPSCLIFILTMPSVCNWVFVTCFSTYINKLCVHFTHFRVIISWTK